MEMEWETQVIRPDPTIHIMSHQSNIQTINDNNYEYDFIIDFEVNGENIENSTFTSINAYTQLNHISIQIGIICLIFLNFQIAAHFFFSSFRELLFISNFTHNATNLWRQCKFLLKLSTNSRKMTDFTIDLLVGWFTDKTYKSIFLLVIWWFWHEVLLGIVFTCTKYLFPELNIYTKKYVKKSSIG